MRDPINYYKENEPKTYLAVLDLHDAIIEGTFGGEDTPLNRAMARDVMYAYFSSSGVLRERDPEVKVEKIYQATEAFARGDTEVEGLRVGRGVIPEFPGVMTIQYPPARR